MIASIPALFASLLLMLILAGLPEDLIAFLKNFKAALLSRFLDEWVPSLNSNGHFEFGAEAKTIDMDKIIKMLKKVVKNMKDVI